jgi:cytidine deaminase
LEINMDFCSMDELAADERELVNRAIQATKHAYANYSHFKVGAALRLANDKIIIGANQENAAFPSGLCAERSAIFAAQSNLPEQPILKMAVAASTDNGLLEDPITPCGACRQVVLEIEDRYKKPVEILLYGQTGVYRIKSIKDLLPLSFVDANMRG